MTSPINTLGPDQITREEIRRGAVLYLCMPDGAGREPPVIDDTRVDCCFEMFIQGMRFYVDPASRNHWLSRLFRDHCLLGRSYYVLNREVMYQMSLAAQRRFIKERGLK